MILADLALWAITAPVALVTGVFGLEVLLGLAPAAKAGAAGLPAPAPIAILMPAHDEAAGIGQTLDRLKQVLPACARILVIADNCSDETAIVARARGAEVVERTDAAHRGKGFALACGRDHLRADPPACVIVMDADCEAETGALEALAELALAADAPVQARYLLRPAAGASPMVEVSTFAFAVKNHIRQLGLKRLGAPAILTGTGMAFPWRIFADAPLATGSIVEDLDLGLDLLLAGHKALFLPSARVWSDASGTAGTLEQRSRWEGGFVATATARGLPILSRGLVRADWSLIWTGLHLLTPPLVLLVLTNMVLLALLAAAALASAATAPLLLLAVLQLAAAIALLAAWVRLGTQFLSPAAALRLPLYAMWKLPMYARLLRRRAPQSWVRTDRSDKP